MALAPRQQKRLNPFWHQRKLRQTTRIRRPQLHSASSNLWTSSRRFMTWKYGRSTAPRLLRSIHGPALGITPARSMRVAMQKNDRLNETADAATGGEVIYLERL